MISTLASRLLSTQLNLERGKYDPAQRRKEQNLTPFFALE